MWQQCGRHVSFILYVQLSFVLLLLFSQSCLWSLVGSCLLITFIIQSKVIYGFH
jgi:hypothetical protein